MSSSSDSEEGVPCDDCELPFGIDVTKCKRGVKWGFTNSETCSACVDCCPGHCDHCGDAFYETRGGRSIVGYDDIIQCSNRTCKRIFHDCWGFCQEGSTCIDCGRRYCKFCSKNPKRLRPLCKPTLVRQTCRPQRDSENILNE